ncbi:MAG: flagellar basal body-associated FliL family protein [Desulfobacterales bacterium]|nr:flagellar basal body-associated FliL family protein [Desulfobacterales bacterium]
MADEERGKERVREVKPHYKTFPTKLVLIVVLVMFLGGGAFALRGLLFDGRLSHEDNQQAANSKETSPASDTSAAIIHELAPFIVNLRGHSGKRYLRTKIELDVENDNVKKELVGRTPQLRDAVLLLLTSKSFEDISSSHGKIQLKNELIARINQVLQGGAVRTLYFTEFVVQ